MIMETEITISNKPVRRLWILRPIDPKLPAWVPWYDKIFGFVVRADSEQEARQFASLAKGSEGSEPWIDPKQTGCIELTSDGECGVIIEDCSNG